MRHETIFVHHDLTTGEISFENASGGFLEHVGALSAEEGARFARALRRALKRADRASGASFAAARDAAPPLRIPESSC